MSDPSIAPEELASALASRLIHDLIGPASGIVSAFDLAEDPRAAAMREEALAMAVLHGARVWSTSLTLARTIYGGGGAAMSQGELAAAAESLFSGSRAKLTLLIDNAPTVASGRIFLGLTQIMAGAASAGGSVSAAHALQDGRFVMTFGGVGPRLRLHPEVALGLTGQGAGEGQLHRWSAAYLLGSIARSAGGGVQCGVFDGGVELRADIRADRA